MKAYFLIVLTAEIFTGTGTSGASRAETAALRYCPASWGDNREANCEAKTNARPCKNGVSLELSKLGITSSKR